MDQLEKVMEFLNEPTSEDQKWNKFLYYPPVRSAVVYVFNLFEEAGTIYNANLLKKEIFKNINLITFPFYFDKAESLIQRMRANEKQVVLLEWEKMVRDFKRS